MRDCNQKSDAQIANFLSSEEPGARMRDCNYKMGIGNELLGCGRKSLEPECGIATLQEIVSPPPVSSRKSLQPECGIATSG